MDLLKGKFGNFETKGLRINSREPQKLESAAPSPPLEWGVANP